MKGYEAVSRADTLQSFESYCEKNCQYSKKQRDVMCGACFMGDAIEIVEDLPPVTPKQKWIPIKTRPMTEEESTYYRNWAKYEAEIFDCPLPEDGQEVLVLWGNNVCVDMFVRDTDGCYFEDRDIDEVTAWMPLPEPYMEGESE